jgi:hypothetical protein
MRLVMSIWDFLQFAAVFFIGIWLVAWIMGERPQAKSIRTPSLLIIIGCVGFLIFVLSSDAWQLTLWFVIPAGLGLLGCFSWEKLWELRRPKEPDFVALDVEAELKALKKPDEEKPGSAADPVVVELFPPSHRPYEPGDAAQKRV